MLNAVIDALTEMASPPLRAVLWKSILLALALIVVLGIGLDRLIVHLVGNGGDLRRDHSRTACASAGRSHRLAVVDRGQSRHPRRRGIFDAGGHRAVVASFFADRIGEEVERAHYPADPPGKALPLVAGDVGRR